MLLTHRAVNNTAPDYFSDLIRFNVKGTTIPTRVSHDPCLLYIPTNSKMCANLIFDRSFMYAAHYEILDLFPFDDLYNI